MVRVLHSADWQLGRAFGRFEPDVRAALVEARFDAIDAIGQTTRTHDVIHVLAAGDVFDTEGPDWCQATIIMRATAVSGTG